MSRICPVKPLYGLDYRAAAQFQDLDNLLIAYARAVQLIEIESQSRFETLQFANRKAGDVDAILLCFRPYA